jgi:hypothetical protein
MEAMNIWKVDTILAADIHNTYIFKLEILDLIRFSVHTLEPWQRRNF